MAVRSKDLLARDTYLNLLRTYEKLTGEFNDLFRPHGLTLAQFNVLRILRGGPEEGASCQYVGERLINRVPDVTRLLDRMQAAGLVRRSRSDRDRRVVLVRLTPEGRRRVDALDEPVLALHRRQLGGLSARELETLNGGLERVLSA